MTIYHTSGIRRYVTKLITYNPAFSTYGRTKLFKKGTTITNTKTLLKSIKRNKNEHRQKQNSNS